MAPAQIFRQLLPLACLLIAACSSSNNNDTVTGKGSIRGIHAVPDINTVSFLIEETLLATLGFKDASGVSEYDDLEYTFSFEIWLPGDIDATVLASQTLKVDPEIEYTFVLAGSLDSPELILWEQFGRNWAEELETADENETEVTVMEVSFGNLSAIAGAVDVYLESPGTSPLTASPKATVSYADLQTAIELLAGDYQLVLTPVGDAPTILFASDPIFVAAASSNLFAIMDDGGLTSGDYSVRWIGGGVAFELFDINLTSEVSVVHTAQGSGPIDVVVGGDFANPLVADLGFAESSSSTTVDAGTLNVNVTPAGNPGVFLAERAFSVEKGSINRMYVVGLPGDLQVVLFSEDRRTLSTHARLQVFQGATRFSAVDFYIVDTDVDISLIGPNYSSFVYGTSTGLFTLEPGEYNFVVTEAGTKNVIGGPYSLDMRAGQNTGAVILDSPSITATDAMFINLLSE